MDGGLFGRDGTQAAPPPRVFPDPLAGLVTGEHRYRPAGAPVAPPVVAPPPAPVPPAPPIRRAPARRAARPASGHVTGTPAAHVPHAGLARHQPDRADRPDPKKGRGALVGCLIALAALGGLLFTVLREIVEAVVDLVR
ncbi:hypothetical protein [Saccharothrix sp. HUAS TT1]|uniref:hypothetical protein n=1 Tax=unclassified Saccharothrix TaxID=2593673 RepID=UPI00345B88D8